MHADNEGIYDIVFSMPGDKYLRLNTLISMPQHVFTTRHCGLKFQILKFYLIVSIKPNTEFSLGRHKLGRWIDIIA